MRCTRRSFPGITPARLIPIVVGSSSEESDPSDLRLRGAQGAAMRHCSRLYATNYSALLPVEVNSTVKYRKPPKTAESTARTFYYMYIRESLEVFRSPNQHAQRSASADIGSPTTACLLFTVLAALVYISFHLESHCRPKSDSVIWNGTRILLS